MKSVLAGHLQAGKLSQAEQSQALPEAQPMFITRFGFHTDATGWNPRARMTLKVMQTTTSHTVSLTVRRRA